MPGRPPTPTRIKLLKGTNRAHRARNEPSPTVGVPEPPVDLRGTALELYEATAPELAALGILTTIDGDVLADYCRWRSVQAEALRIVEEGGLTFTTERGYVQQRPEVSIASTAQKHLNTLGAKLGLSPADRTRLAVVVGERKKNQFALLREQSA